MQPANFATSENTVMTLLTRRAPRLIFCRCLSSLKRPVLDIKSIIARKDEYRDSINKRKLPQSYVQNLEDIVERRNHEVELAKEIDSLRHERSIMGEAMKKEKSPQIKESLIELKLQLKYLEEQHKELSSEILDKAEGLPNLIDPTVAESEAEIVQFINCESEKDAVSIKPATTFDHREIAENLSIVDFQSAAKVSGSSWYYLIGDGALLEQALVQYGLKKARQYGYRMVTPPSIVKNEFVHACGFKPNDQNNEKQIYGIEGGNLSLTGTAEIPLGAIHSGTDFENGQKFPIKYVGVSRAYRAEAGARGKDTKGLYRVHEFTKVELFHFTTPEYAKQELEDLRQLQTEIIEELGLMSKMIKMPADDLGAPALMKYDCEAWMPGRGNWGELTSSSNCGDYQARRLGIRYRNSDNKLQFVHTLNGTCMAVPRVIVAIIEQFYDEATNTIKIPPVLQEYMDGKDAI